MTYVGSYAIDRALVFYVNTIRLDTGVATDADSVPTYRVYENETTTPLLTGSMALLDSANTAGWYSESITLSAANGFENNKNYSIYIAATVNGVAGATHRTFQMLADVNVKLIDGVTPDDTATIVDAVFDEAIPGHADAGSFGEYVSVANTKLDTISGFVDTEVSAIKTKTDQMVFSTTNRLDVQVFGVQNNAITDAAVAADVTIASVTGAVGSVTGAVGSVSGNVTGSVGSVATGGITAASFAADAITAAKVAADVGTEFADAFLDRTAGVETGTTLRQWLRLAGAVLLGKATGLNGATITFRDIADTKDRVVVAQTSSARTSVTKDST